MRAEVIIKRFKQTIEGLIQDMDLFKKTEGAQGSDCMNSDKLFEMLNWTDEKILKYEEEEMGYYIFDKEEYLANKKEKTN